MEPLYHLERQLFDTVNELKVVLYSFTSDQGYAMSRWRTKRNGTGIQKIWLTCNRFNSCKQLATLRQTLSRGTGCGACVILTRATDPFDLQDKWLL